MDSEQQPEALASAESDSIDSVQSGRGAPFQLEIWVGCILGATVLIAPLVVIQNAYNYDLVKTAAIHAGAALMAAVFAAAHFKKMIVRSTISRLHAVSLLFLLWSALSLAWAHNWHVALPLLLHWTVCWIVFWIVGLSLRTRQWIIFVTICITASAAAISALGCVQHLFGFDGIPQYRWPASTFVHPNMAVHAVAMTAPLAWGLFFHPDRRLQLFAGAAAAVSALYLIYAEAMAGWVAFAASALWFAAWVVVEVRSGKTALRWTRMRTAAAACALTAVLILMPFSQEGFTPRLPGLSKGMSTASSWREGVQQASSGRLLFWQNHLAMFRARPVFGWGLENTEVFYPLFSRAEVNAGYKAEQQIRYVHNEYLQAAVELGIPGLVLLLAVFALALKRALKAARTQDSFRCRITAVAFSAGIVAFMVESFFTFPMHRAVPTFFLSIYLGLISGMARPESTKTPVLPLPVPRKTAFAVACLCALVSIGAVIGTLTAVRADIHFYSSQAAAAHGQWEASLRHGLLAEKNAPERKDVLFYIGSALRHTGDPERAAGYFIRVLDGFPYHMNAVYNLALIYEGLGRPEDAMAMYERFIEIVPDEAGVYNRMAIIAFQRGRPKESEALLIKGLSQPQENHRLYFNLGLVRLDQRKFPEAARAFQSLVRRFPDVAEAHRHLAEIYLVHLNLPEKAVPHMRAHIQRKPQAPASKEFVRQLETMERK